MRLLALDFDGVISDSAPEAFLVALRTFDTLRPESGLAADAAALAGSAAGTNSMMRYVGSIVGVGILAGVLNTEASIPGVDTFRVIMGLVAVFAALSIISASQIHLFPNEDL